MNRVTRLAGALLLESAGQYFLVGDLKRPCNFAATGFVPPPQPIDALANPCLQLAPAGALTLSGPWLALGNEPSGAALAQQLAERLVITRNASVSDRLWRLILSADPDADPPPADAVIDARWLVEMPAHLWQIVRDAVLKCT